MGPNRSEFILYAALLEGTYMTRRSLSDSQELEVSHLNVIQKVKQSAHPLCAASYVQLYVQKIAVWYWEIPSEAATYRGNGRFSQNPKVYSRPPRFRTGQ